MAFLRSAKVRLDFVQSLSGHDTGTVEVSGGNGSAPVYRLIRPAAYDRVELTAARIASMARWKPDWIYYGTLFHKELSALRNTDRILAACPTAQRFCDVNLRSGEYSPGHVEALASAADILKLSEEESGEFASMLGIPATESDPERLARALAERFDLRAVCVTRGSKGCSILWDRQYIECPACPVEVKDTVGAGDAFAAAFLHGWQSRWGPALSGAFANRLGALVANRTGATPEWHPDELQSLG